MVATKVSRNLELQYIYHFAYMSLKNHKTVAFNHVRRTSPQDAT